MTPYKIELIMSYCSYYQAQVERSLCWFLAATLRSFEHLSFDRSLDGGVTSTFEFFVPQEMEGQFERIMEYYLHKGIVKNIQKLPNRLLDPKELV
jgi:hypothetical protein